MKIAAVADVHYPHFSNIFEEAINSLKVLVNREKIDVFILAGDITQKGNIANYKKALDKITENFRNAKILACFGNEEYDGIHEELKKIKEVEFLDDEVRYFKKEKTFAFIGSRGVLDLPTFWQQRNIPNIREIYMKRAEKIRYLLHEAKEKSDFVVYFSHYSPTYATLEGERKNVYPNLGSKKIEKILLETNPNLVIHGHAHHGKKFSLLNGIYVFNVALPLNKRIVLIDTENLPKKGLEKFW